MEAERERPGTDADETARYAFGIVLVAIVLTGLITVSLRGYAIS